MIQIYTVHREDFEAIGDAVNRVIQELHLDVVDVKFIDYGDDHGVEAYILYNNEFRIVKKIS